MRFGLYTFCVTAVLASVLSSVLLYSVSGHSKRDSIIISTQPNIESLQRESLESSVLEAVMPIANNNSIETKAAKVPAKANVESISKSQGNKEITPKKQANKDIKPLKKTNARYTQSIEIPQNTPEKYTQSREQAVSVPYKNRNTHNMKY